MCVYVCVCLCVCVCVHIHPTAENLDTHVGLDLVKAKASETRDKYYACFGVSAKPKTRYPNILYSRYNLLSFRLFLLTDCL